MVLDFDYRNGRFLKNAADYCPETKHNYHETENIAPRTVVRHLELFLECRLHFT